MKTNAALLALALLICAGFASAQQQPAAPRNEKVYQIGPGITAPRVLSKVEPEYTEEARAAKIDGAVVLSVVVGADGKAHDINVLNTPDSGLGIKAIEAIQQWKFAPATKDGEAVAVRANIEVNFKLK